MYTQACLLRLDPKKFMVNGDVCGRFITRDVGETKKNKILVSSQVK